MTYHEHYEKRIKHLQDMVSERDNEIKSLKDKIISLQPTGLIGDPVENGNFPPADNKKHFHILYNNVLRDLKDD